MSQPTQPNYDSRTLERLINEGRITPEAYSAYLAALPDLSDDNEECVTQPPQRDGRRS
jgi:hypothetical protein